MSKRTVFTTVSPIPVGVSRAAVMETLHNHLEMIDLNPLVEERHPIKPPTDANPEEYQCQWYSLTDRVSYLPGGLASGKVTYNVCFHHLERGLQTHCYAPLGLNIKGKWTLGGSLPGEPIPPPELGIGAPLTGLYLREDVDMRCNIMMTSFVRKTLKSSHARLVDRLVIKAQFDEVEIRSDGMSQASLPETLAQYARSQATSDHSPSDHGDVAGAAGIEDGSIHSVSSRFSNQSGAPQLAKISSPEIRWPPSYDFGARSNSPQPASSDFRGRSNSPQLLSSDYRGRSNSAQQQQQQQQQEQQQQQQSLHPASLTVRTPPPRSISEERQQKQFPGFVANEQQKYRASIGGYPGSQQRPQPPYPESAIEPPQGARSSWNTLPSQNERASWQNEAPLPLVTNRNRNGSSTSNKDLDMAFQEAAPTYHGYSEPRRTSNGYAAYGAAPTRANAYDGLVYGAAELS